MTDDLQSFLTGSVHHHLSHLGDPLEHPQSVGEEQEEDLVLDKVEEAEEQRADARRDGAEDVDVPGALLRVRSSCIKFDTCQFSTLQTAYWDNICRRRN